MIVRFRLRVPPLPNVRLRLDADTFDRALVAGQVTWRRSVIPGFVRWSVYLLKTAAVSLFTLGVWRLGNDVGATEPFFVTEGFFSHWQVYFGLAAAGGLAAQTLRQAVPESRLEALMAEAEELEAEGFMPMPPSIPPSIESPCSVEVRRAIG